MNCSCYMYEMSISISSDRFQFEVNFVRYQIGHTCLFLRSVCLENLFPTLYSEQMSIFVVECVSCKQQNVGSCFRIQSLSLCLFIGELSPLILSDINDQWQLTLVIFCGGSLCVFPFFELCWWRVVRCLCYYGCCWLPCFVIFPSSFFCKTRFVATYCLNLFLSWNILFSPSMVNASFAGYSSLGLHPWSLSVCNTSIQDLLALMVSIEKSGAILIGFPLYVT